MKMRMQLMVAAMCFVAVGVFASCGKEDPKETEPTTAELLVGTWSTIECDGIPSLVGTDWTFEAGENMSNTDGDKGTYKLEGEHLSIYLDGLMGVLEFDITKIDQTDMEWLRNDVAGVGQVFVFKRK